MSCTNHKFFLLLLIPQILGIRRERDEEVPNDGIYHDELMKAKFTEFGLVPTIFRQGPKHYLYTRYSEGLVQYGNILHPKKIFQELPHIHFDLEGNAFQHFLLLLLDVDHPSESNPTGRSLLLWMFADMRGYNLKTGLNITERLDPFPVPNTGLHRYVLVAYRQTLIAVINKPFDEFKNLTFAQREGFNVTSFEDKYLLGRPYAGNFFRAESIKKPGG